MREIKFRVWNEKFKQFHYFDLIDTTIKKEYTLTEWIDLPKQQFTGLVDKNGKDIYEGDILGGLYDGGYIGWCERCKQFQYFGCKDECFACGGDVHWFELSVEKELEVIGNIHENPELLN